MSTSTKLKTGDSIQTNARYAKIMGNRTPVSGVLIKEVSWLSGVWSVDMDGFTKPQRLHESMMEKK